MPARLASLAEGRQRAVTIAAWILVATAGYALGQFALPPQGLRGHYFTNLTRTGQPVAVVIDKSISTDTLDNGTAGIWESFSVEWTGAIVITSPGTYRFSTVSDDGSELEIDDQIVVRNGGRHGAQEATGQIALSRGLHSIRLRYEQAGGSFELSLNYAPEGEGLAPIPASVLLPDRLSNSEYLARSAIPFLSAAAALALLLFISRRRIRARRLVWEPRTAHAVLIIIAVAVTARILMLLGSSGILWGDSDVFIETFGAIRNGRFFEHDPFRTLLYPYFLTAFLIWSGERPMDQIFIGAQHLLGVISAVAFFFVARRAFGSRVALAGALIFSLHSTQLFYENSVLSECFFVCVLSLSLLVMSSYLRAPSPGRAAATGVVCLALTMTRPVAEFFVLIPVALGMVAAKQWRQRLACAATIVGIYAACLAPWAALNQRTYGFYGVALGQGLGLAIRAFEIERYDLPEDTRYPEIKEILDYGRRTQYSPVTFMRDELKRRRHSTAQADAMMGAASMEAIAAHPIGFVAGSFRQWWRLLGGPLGDEQICTSVEFGSYLCSVRTIGYAREPFLNRPRRPHEPIRPLVVGYFRHFKIPMHIISGLAAFATVILVAGVTSGVNLTGVLLALTAAYMTFLPAVAQSPQDRYRVPVDALLFMLAVFGASQFYQRFIAAPGEREWPRQDDHVA